MLRFLEENLLYCNFLISYKLAPLFCLELYGYMSMMTCVLSWSIDSNRILCATSRSFPNLVSLSFTLPDVPLTNVNGLTCCLMPKLPLLICCRATTFAALPKPRDTHYRFQWEVPNTLNELNSKFLQLFYFFIFQVLMFRLKDFGK